MILWSTSLDAMSVSSLFPNTFSKWTGLGLDFVIYMLTLLCLYKLLMRLFSSRDIASAGVILYGLCLLGMSTMLMIRMYVLLTLLSVLLAYLVVRLMERFNPRLCPLIALCILAGLMTQYYFVFYAFFLCAAYVLYALIKKQYKALLWFIPWALAGALCLLLVFPLYTDGLPSSTVDLMLDTTFESAEALAGYSVHPEHVAVADGKVRPFTAVRSCMDFEV